VSQFAAARRLSRLGVLVRSPRTLEALGRVDTFCFDKTGTLTEGRLAVTRLAGAGKDRADLPFEDPDARDLLRAASWASPREEKALSHATDRAIVEAARERLGPGQEWSLIREQPFEPSRGYSAALCHAAAGTVLAVKGAPEVVLDRCATADGGRELAGEHRDAVARRVQELAEDGLRVIAVAVKRLGDQQAPGDAAREAAAGDGGAHASGPGGGPGAGGGEDDIDALATDLNLLGFVGIADTPRPGAAETIERLAGAGVRVTMITGDHPVTASAIARQLGIPGSDTILTGTELEAMPDRERAERVPRTAVFARVSPEQKVRVVQALQRAGRVVAMTGDGVNDAAAIRLADVGIGVAAKGSASARTAASLVLTDPDPGRLVDMLAEGRSLWHRVRDAVSILVGGNAGEVAFTVIGTGIGGRAPLNTRQLLLVNMFTDMLPALAVALGPVGGGKASAGTVDLSAGPASLSRTTLARSLLVRGAATALGASGAWYVGRLGGPNRAGTMGLAALVMTQLGQTVLTGWRSPLVVVTCAASAAALVAVVETPGVSRFFGCTPLGPAGWGIVAASSALATVGSAAVPRLLPASS
jgi:cation-transporting ATPase I